MEAGGPAMISEVSWDSRRWDHVAATLRDETQGEGHVKQAEVYARCFSPEDDSPKDIMAAAAAHGETDVFQDGAPPLYRLASMTKAVVSVCALQCLERGLFTLGTPIERWVPELANLDVVDDDGTLRPAGTAITVKMLLNHTSGLSYGFLVTEAAGLRTHRFYEENGVFDIPHAPEHTSDELLARLSKCPLAHEPGTAYTYGLSTDVLGILLSRATGRPLDELLREGILEPCGMKDTFFHCPAGRKIEKLEGFPL